MDGNSVVRAYVGLGSNLDNPVKQVQRALIALQNLPHSRCIAHSILYISEPMGLVDQPDYINAVAALDTRLLPLSLLQALQQIEAQQGRVRTSQKWGPRSLDLDLLLYGDMKLSSEVLTLPHPGISLRNFVLYPLMEIAPELSIPHMGSVKQLVENSSDKGLRRLEYGQ